MRTEEQVEVFRQNARTGLAGIYALSIPAMERRHQNRRMWIAGECHPDAPESTRKPLERVDLPSELKQVKAVQNYLVNQITELRAQKKKQPSAF